MKKIIYLKETSHSYQLLKTDGHKVLMSQIHSNNKHTDTEKCNLAKNKNTAIRIFAKIAKYGVDLYLLSEIVKDNVLKR